MHTRRDLLNMVATEAIEGGDPRHYFDELNRPASIPRHRLKCPGPEVKYDLRLVRDKDGALKWED